MISGASVCDLNERRRLDDGQASFLAKDFAVEECIYLPLSTRVEFTESVCRTKNSTIGGEKQGGKISLLNLHHRARKIIRLFTDFIDPIGFAFHNFLVSAAAFVVWNQ